MEMLEMLVPDLSGDLLEEIHNLEEWSMALDAAQQAGCVLGFDAGAVRTAVAVLWGVASRAATDADAVGSGGPVGSARLLAPDGRHEHEPIRFAAVDAAHVGVLRGAVAACTSPSGDLEWALESAVERWRARPGHEVDVTAPLRSLAAVLQVLTMADEDVAVLRAAMADPANRRSNGDVVLPRAAAAAHGRVADRITSTFYGPHGVLERWRMG